MELDKLYNLRNDFTVIGLTGRKGAGCSEVAKILSNTEVSKLNIREIETIETVADNSEYEPTNFSRKYKICKDYISNNWTKYKKIKYTDVVLLLTLRESSESYNLLFDELNIFFESDFINLKSDIDFLFQENIEILKSINPLPKIDEDLKDKDKLEELYNVFFENDEFINFSKKFFQILNKYDFYQRMWFLHRISNNLRKTGSPWTTKIETNTIQHIYTVSEAINRLIKAWKTKNNVHIVIDSLRNSLELMFFKERYSAFYMISVSSDFRRENLNKKIVNRILNVENVKEVVDEILDLDATEYRCGDFKQGRFWAPDVQNCIQKADIHLINRINPDDDESKKQKKWLKDRFFSLDEQLIKYLSLIKQPGIITPSPIERSMQIANSAKLNSGCVSRQVGATITDENFSVKSIGWNDVPAGHTPCNLRNIKNLEDKLIDKNSFTPFEKGEQSDSKKFNTYITGLYKEVDNDDLKGKNISFCFKTLYNNFKGEDNQVHTRSLHAEENAMLQISKYGGVGLKEGYLFTTASPCELCSKKAYQLGIKHIYYIDPYPGISKSHILTGGKEETQPEMKLFSGAIGNAFHKLYDPFFAYKDELTLLTGVKPKTDAQLITKKILNNIDDRDNQIKNKLDELENKNELNHEKIEEILRIGLGLSD